MFHFHDFLGVWPQQMSSQLTILHLPSEHLLLAPSSHHNKVFDHVWWPRNLTELASYWWYVSCCGPSPVRGQMFHQGPLPCFTLSAINISHCEPSWPLSLPAFTLWALSYRAFSINLRGSSNSSRGPKHYVQREEKEISPQSPRFYFNHTLCSHALIRSDSLIGVADMWWNYFYSPFLLSNIWYLLSNIITESQKSLKKKERQRASESMKWIISPEQSELEFTVNNPPHIPHPAPFLGAYSKAQPKTLSAGDPERTFPSALNLPPNPMCIQDYK